MDKDQEKGAGPEVNADLKEATKVAAGTGETGRTGEPKKDARIAQQHKSSAANDDLMDLPKA
jgi:hypothetical protein